MRSGAIALWVAGEGSAERAVQLVAELGYSASPVTQRHMTSVQLRSGDPAGGEAQPSARQVDLAPGGDPGSDVATAGCRFAATCARPTRPRPSRRSPSWGRASRGLSPAARAPTSSWSGRACAARDPGAESIDVRNAGTLLRILPGWLAGQPRGQLDARRRREHPPPPRRSRRAPAAAHGRERRLPPGRAARRWSSRARTCTASSTSCPSPARRSSPACCSPACWPRARPRSWSSLPSRDHTEVMLRAAGPTSKARMGAYPCPACDGSSSIESTCPGTSPPRRS